ncbi:MAG: leucine--tRNA ligase [Planctomycetes bacterium]|nr:leucine--tRNA ligase [Planctomycetota bacterium]
MTLPEDYDASVVEAKWRRRWRELGVATTDLSRHRDKMVVLVMFPYPSGDRLHIGHWYNFAPADSWARFQRMRGRNVFEPMGYDAFGLPAENYAIQHGVHPAESTRANVAYIRGQLEAIGTLYDWSRELNTSDPEYYRWTQWLFLALRRRGLAYRARAPVNWCPACGTVLANEQVEEGRCERCESEVTKKDLEQWFFRITDYAERLLAGLDTLEGRWPAKTLLAQRHWIGRSEGAEVDFQLVGRPERLSIFTTRPDTLYGVTYMVLAPEHPLVETITEPARRGEVGRYAEAARGMRDIDREALGREKTGVFTGAWALNPLNGERVPVWVADYVLAGYGTGAIMAVPGHDPRDHDFAAGHGLPVRRVIEPADGSRAPEGQAYSDPSGRMVGSGPFDGLAGDEARGRVVRELERRGVGRGRVHYRLRDWLISRQRYWGAPIPVVHCGRCGVVDVPEEGLPVLLPERVDFQAPRGERSPLITAQEWVRTACPACGGEARREVDTMDTFVDSSWYFLRYLSAGRSDLPFDREVVDRWLPVDMYIGGPEHATKHLIYARFITMVLKDLGWVGFEEPFARLFHQGLITRDGDKMSKSRGNVVSPDAFVGRYGSDVFRMYMMFMGSFADGGDWNDQGITGIDRFVARTWRLYRRALDSPASTAEGASGVVEARRALHASVQAVTRDLEGFAFNTAIARLMELVGVLGRTLDAGPVDASFLDDALDRLNRLLAPFAPHLAEELWEARGGEGLVVDAPWPDYDAELARAPEVEVAIQVTGKVRARIRVPADADEETLKEMALAHERIRELVGERPIRKLVVVPGRLVNIVV